MSRPTMYRLTRYLYIHDEVVLALLTAVISRRDLNECYFWLFELYFSGFGATLFPMLRQLYADFYAERHPWLAAYIQKKESTYDDAVLLKAMEHTTIGASALASALATAGTGALDLPLSTHLALLQPAACVVRNLFRLPASANAFLRRQFQRREIQRILPQSILPASIGPASIGPASILPQSILPASIGPASMDWHVPSTGAQRVPINAVPINAVPINAVPINAVPISADITALLAADLTPVPCVHDTLYVKRLFSIPPAIAAFKLARWQLYELGDTYLDFLEENWYHWEYYAMRSPVWLARLHQCEGEVNEAEGQLAFASDEWQETFYGAYAYDFDELGRDALAVSHGELLPLHCTWMDWLREVGLADTLEIQKLEFLLSPQIKFVWLEEDEEACASACAADADLDAADTADTCADADLDAALDIDVDMDNTE